MPMAPMSDYERDTIWGHGGKDTPAKRRHDAAFTWLVLMALVSLDPDDPYNHELARRYLDDRQREIDEGYYDDEPPY